MDKQEQIPYLLLLRINDSVFTGAGNDEVDTQTATSPIAGRNRINLGGGNDTIFVSKSDSAFGGAGNDVFDATNGRGSNRMSGDAENDIFYFGSNDRALGGDGNDQSYVQSGGGNLLSGGAGADQFWIVNGELPSIANTILDFQVGTDVIGILGGSSLGIYTSNMNLIQVGSDTQITFDGQTLAILGGIEATSLNPDDASQFVFA